MVPDVMKTLYLRHYNSQDKEDHALLRLGNTGDEICRRKTTKHEVQRKWTISTEARSSKSSSTPDTQLTEPLAFIARSQYVYDHHRRKN
ncbi:hypothetical protein M8J76_010375 [Diaphorina citri]|nr:hypothetical protein M8J76_010375 [Diaphorina citri]